MAVLALGVGLGLSTTMFAVLDATLHPYVAYREPDQLFSIRWWFGRRSPMSPAELYRYLRDETRSFEAIAPRAWDRVTLERGGDAREVGVTRVTPRYFEVLGVRARTGRLFVAGDDDVAVLSEDLHRQLFGRRRLDAGATLTINGRSVTVIGVLPRGAGRSELWMPLSADVDGGGGSALYMRPFVRLRAGVSREQAADELTELARVLTERFGAREAPYAFVLDPVVERREELRDIHKAMVGSALVVLLIACVNLAHLMLARGLARRRELALRMALGAGRATVVREMFVECAIVTLGGAALGAVVAIWGADVLRNRMPQEVSWIGLVQPQLSWRVFALSGLAAALSAVLFGLLPAIRVALAVSLDEPLKDDTGTTTGRVRQRYNGLVIAEVALALVLLMGGGLLLRTVQQLRRAEPAFDTRRLYRAWLSTRLRGDTTAARPVDWRHVATTVGGVEGVQGFAIERQGRLPGTAVTAELSEDSTRTITMSGVPVVSPSYLQVLGLPILKGRDFLPGDESGPGVAIVDALAAQRLYPRGDAVGRMIKLAGPQRDGPWVPIVGITSSPAALDVDETNRYARAPVVLVARREVPGEDPLRIRGMLVIRATSRDAATPARLQARLRALPGVVGAFVVPWDATRQAELASRGFLAKVFVGMGVVALGLAALGLYGILAYAVGRRMREFGVRLALGADPAGLRRMILHDGLVMVLAGIGVGAFVALATARYLDAVLVAVLPSDVLALVASEAVLVSVGMAAALVPARRAARANPLDILRAV
jgi:predicted permease